MQSYFVDTNYILRFLLKDNLLQQTIAGELFEKGTDKKVILFTSIVVLFELEWVLSNSYKLNKKTVILNLQRILQMNIFQFEEKNVFKKLLKILKN